MIQNFTGVMLALFMILGVIANAIKFIKMYSWWIQPLSLVIVLLFILYKLYKLKLFLRNRK